MHIGAGSVYNRGAVVEAQRAGPRIWWRGLIITISAMAAACASRQPAIEIRPPQYPRASVVGVASWYGPGFNGHRTSSGEVYDQERLTAASTLFPLGTRLLVTNLSNGRSVEVRINDHGPYVRGRGIDLSHEAARALGILGAGTARVRMDVIESPAGGPPIGQRYCVQVGSFSDAVNARAIRTRLVAAYPNIRVTEARAGGARFYRVRIASTSRKQAESDAAKLARIGYNPIIVTE
jgi:rare lipoprotein A